MFTYDLMIVDDLYPHPISLTNWRGIEIRCYMEYFKRVKLYSNLLSIALVGTQTIEDVKVFYKSSDYVKYKVKYIPNYSFPRKKAKLFYAIFLNNIYACLPLIEKYQTPFVFTLYPGGGFGIHNNESDQKLKRVMASKQFHGVICNSCITKQYLLENHFCNEDVILYQKGIIMDESLFINNKTFNKMHFGINKDILDIVFVAFKYTEKGEDKGYDTFVDVARILLSEGYKMHFHVVGNFEESTIDILDIHTHFTFHGVQLKEWFDVFYQDKDLLISPNKSGNLTAGAFDGFPTTTAVDAMLRKVGVLCTDDFNQNDNQFTNNEDLIILEDVSVEKIVKQIKFLYNNPMKIKELGEKGYESAINLYSYENQIIPRIKFIKQAMERAGK